MLGITQDVKTSIELYYLKLSYKEVLKYFSVSLLIAISIYAISILYLYHKRFDKGLFCQLNPAEFICDSKLNIHFGLLAENQMITRSFPCHLEKDDRFVLSDEFF